MYLAYLLPNKVPEIRAISIDSSEVLRLHGLAKLHKISVALVDIPCISAFIGGYSDISTTLVVTPNGNVMANTIDENGYPIMLTIGLIIDSSVKPALDVELQSHIKNYDIKDQYLVKVFNSCMDQDFEPM